MNLKRARKDVEAMAARCGELADAFVLPDQQARAVNIWAMLSDARETLLIVAEEMQALEGEL